MTLHDTLVRARALLTVPGAFARVDASSAKRPAIRATVCPHLFERVSWHSDVEHEPRPARTRYDGSAG